MLHKQEAVVGILYFTCMSLCAHRERFVWTNIFFLLFTMELTRVRVSHSADSFSITQALKTSAVSMKRPSLFFFNLLILCAVWNPWLTFPDATVLMEIYAPLHLTLKCVFVTGLTSDRANVGAPQEAVLFMDSFLLLLWSLLSCICIEQAVFLSSISEYLSSKKGSRHSFLQCAETTPNCRMSFSPVFNQVVIPETVGCKGGFLILTRADQSK